MNGTEAQGAEKTFGDGSGDDRRGLRRRGNIEQMRLEGVAADEQADVVKFFAAAIVADVV